MIYMQIETPAEYVGYMLWELEEVTCKFLVELLLCEQWVHLRYSGKDYKNL